jgi:3-oxoacyl-[acyl-carrier-protein] synthase II
VVTGLGAVTPLGTGVAALLEGLRAGRSGVRTLPFTHPRLRSRAAAMVWPDAFDPAAAMSPADLERLPRQVPMALAAAREALAQAGLGNVAEDTHTARRTGLILGTGGGGIDFTIDQMDAMHSERKPSLWTITNATHGNLAGELSIRLGLRGPSWCVSTGCASSSDAAALSLRTLRWGDAGVDKLVVVGTDAHVRWETLYAMELLGVLSTSQRPQELGGPATTSRPFDATRDGFVLGEGAWAIVLERAGALDRPGVRPLATFAGAGSTCDAFHRVRPAPDMEESARAMLMAVADAGLTPGDIGVVHYHGTSTRINDELETAAVKRAFGAPAAGLVGHSVKGALGHPQGASGLAALVATVGAMTAPEPFLPPTAHLTTPDPACDLDYSPLRPRPVTAARSRNVLVNCLAFGAKNSALVLRDVR